MSIRLNMALMMALLLLGACKRTDNSGTSSDLERVPPGVQIFAGIKDLPECTKELEGELVYVQEDKKFRGCRSGKWEILDIKGEKGDVGGQGPNGVVDSTNAAQWRAVWENNVGSVAYIECRYQNDGNTCAEYVTGTAFVVGTNLAITNGHVLRNKITPTTASCGELKLKDARLWYPTGKRGDSQHDSKGSDGLVAKVDRGIEHTDDMVLLQTNTGTRRPLDLNPVAPSADGLSGNGPKLGDELLNIGFSGSTTYAHLASGRLTGMKETKNVGGLGFLATLVQDGLIESGKLILEYDLVTGAGSSGGPVFHLNGMVVGVNFAGDSKDSDTEFGYAVPVTRLLTFLNESRNWKNLAD